MLSSALLHITFSIQTVILIASFPFCSKKPPRGFPQVESSDPESEAKQPLSQLNGTVAAAAGKRTSSRGAAASAAKLAAAAATSHKVTEFFSVRRSERTKKPGFNKKRSPDALEPELELALELDDDSGLDVSVRNFPEKGRGVVADRDYARGEFVVEYAGDLIDVGEAKEREADYSLDLSTGCYMYYFKHKGKQYW